MEPQHLTFQNLIDHATTHANTDDGFSTQSLPNAISALRSFVHDQGLSLERPVGASLRGQFAERLAAHLAKLRTGSTAANRSAHNRASLLRRWRRVLLRLDRALNARLGRQSPLQQALVEIFSAGRAVRPTARAAGVPHATLKRWLSGHRPNAQSMPGLVRLERYLALPPGTLVDLVDPAAKSGPADKPSPSQSIAYRDRLKRRSAAPYRLREVSAQLMRQWSGLVAFKTAARTPVGLKRQRHGRWSVTPHPVTRRVPWYAASNGMYCATAALHWSLVSSYLGWLTLPIESGGLCWQPTSAQSLTHLADSGLLERYVAWRQAASAGIFHAGISAFLRMVASMCHPETGYLTQKHADLLEPEDAQAAAPSWLAKCADAHACARELLEASTRDARPSRNPNEPLAALLALENPLLAIAQAVERMNADRPVCGSIAEAVWFRDRLMLKLLMSNPLRAKNVLMLTFSDHAPHVSPPPTGAVLYRAGTAWRIYVSSTALKNFRGAGSHDYDAPVRLELTDDIDEYLRFHRPRIAKPGNPYVFVSAKDDGPMYSLNRRFAAITKRYIPECPGFGPHALRHIVATSILKMQPNAWSVAAWVLHDREQTVRKHYAHLRSDDAARWLSPVLDGPFKRM